MGKTRKHYTVEFKIEAVRLYEAGGRTVAEIEQELGIGKGNLWRWLGRDGSGNNAGTVEAGGRTPEQERIRALERENERLRQERDILKKAVAIFSQPKQ